MKEINNRHTCEALLSLIRIGRARVVKEHGEDGPSYCIFSASGSAIGQICNKYQYMFERAVIERGNGDGLFDGCSQTVRADQKVSLG
jgi:hypothetical protein